MTTDKFTEASSTRISNNTRRRQVLNKQNEVIHHQTHTGYRAPCYRMMQISKAYLGPKYKANLTCLTNRKM